MRKTQMQKINEYRTKHHRCRLCKYWRYRCSIGLPFNSDYCECVLKNKRYFYCSATPKLKGMFCSYYEPRETER